MIKKDITFDHLNSDNEVNTKLIKTSINKIFLNLDKNLFIIRAYASGDDSNIFFSDLPKIFDFLNLNKPNNFFVLLSDLNAKQKS